MIGAEGVWLLLALVGVAVVLAVVLRPRTPDADGDDGRAEAILADRLATGEISETEYRERSAVLAAHRPRQRTRWWPAVVAALAVVVALVLAVGTLAGWPGGGLWGPMHPMPHMHDMRAPAVGGEAPAPLPGATELTIESGEMWFAPDAVEVAEGEPVNLTVANQGQVFHDLVIDELDLRIPVDAGATATAGVRIDQPGAYEYYCSVPGHAAAGMRGTLIVRPATP